MRPICLTFIILFFCSSIKAAIQPTDTTAKPRDTTQLKHVQVDPEYPGGDRALSRLITKNLQYPEVALLLGVNGKVYLQFIIERDGKITDVVPISCVGAGCEAEAVKVLYLSKPWKPGIQDGKPVRVQYTLPITFTSNKDAVTMRELRHSEYGFVFEIKGVTYSIDDAEKLLGKSFSPELIEIALPFWDPAKFPMEGKKEVYCLRIKG